jgi:hypothetical protein
MMTNAYLKPMLDPGSPRVFNCCVMTQKLLKRDPGTQLFFKNRQLNNILLIKDTIPENERVACMPSVGTKLYIPFNEADFYEGGRTLFLHDKGIKNTMLAHYGESALDSVLLEEDFKMMRILGGLPSLDPFLMKDVFRRENIKVNEAYFEVSEEAWREIELFMLQRFEPLVRAAFPDADGTDEKARTLIDKMWEGRDLEALKPLIMGFRLPQEKALDIFASWRGIVYYSYQYYNSQLKFVSLIQWLTDVDHPYTGVPSAENKALQASLKNIRDHLRQEWQMIERLVREYESSYDKMFKEKSSSGEFLSFLKNSNETYWTLGNSLGKTNHAIYCWDTMTSRFENRALPWDRLQGVVGVLESVFKKENNAAKASAWA